MELPRPQVAVLEAASAQEAQSIERLAEQIDLAPATVTGAAFELEERGLVTIQEQTRSTVALTSEGQLYHDEGLPEIRLYHAAAGTDDALSVQRAASDAGLDDEGIEVALANFARKEFGTVSEGAVHVDPAVEPDDDEEAAAIAMLAETDDGRTLNDLESVDDIDTAVIDRLESRGLVAITDATERLVTLTDEGVTALMEGVQAREAVDELTADMLTSGSWRDVEFSEYNVTAEGTAQYPGRIHVLRRTVERVKEVLVGMGFKEMDGPHVDADFYINDCLFMPQDHPARTHWGRFELERPARIDSLPDEIVERVERAHKDGVGPDGEGYHSDWDRDFAKALALRGHTTSLSARYLAGQQVGELEPPQRYFSVEKAYRNDELDATHLLEFFQIEGWVMAEELSIRDLMGTFEEFYHAFGITDIEFKPTYNPYTEPSFELFGTHPETGELIEIGNSGMFRREVLGPLGVEADVMAWGLAGERLAMLITGAADIRDIHGTLTDLQFLRDAEVVY